GGVSARRISGHPARDWRRLLLQGRPGAADDSVRNVLADHAAQRREPRPRPVAARQRLSLYLRNVRRIPHRQVVRHQYPGPHLHVVHRPVELLQLRQLDVPAFVRVVEYALVLQWRAGPDLPDGKAQDRALARQRLAVLWQVQQLSWTRSAGTLAADRLALNSGQPI